MTKTTSRSVCYITWHGKPSLAHALDNGGALLTVHNGRCTNYIAQRLSDKDGTTVGYRLTKLTQFIVDRKVYDIEVTGKNWNCDCPDANFRNAHSCKHVRALKAALVRHRIISDTF